MKTDIIGGPSLTSGSWVWGLCRTQEWKGKNKDRRQKLPVRYNSLPDLWNPVVQCRNHKSSPIIHILSQNNLIPQIDIYLFKVHSKIVFPSTPRPSLRSRSSKFTCKKFWKHFYLPLLLQDFIFQVIICHLHIVTSLLTCKLTLAWPWHHNYSSRR